MRGKRSHKMKFVNAFVVFACICMYRGGIKNVNAGCKFECQPSSVAVIKDIEYCHGDARTIPCKSEGDAATTTATTTATTIATTTTTTMFSGNFSYSARYGGIEHIEADVQVYINAQLTKSFEYLLLATHFNSFVLNRPGFRQLYQNLSDRCFNDAIDLSLQLTRRGGALNLTTKRVSPAFVSTTFPKLELSELASLSLVLKGEKQLAEGANYVQLIALNSSKIDSEFAHYMEQHFLTKQAESVRQLAGYANDLNKLLNDTAESVALYLFDQYLNRPMSTKKSSGGLHG